MESDEGEAYRALLGKMMDRVESARSHAYREGVVTGILLGLCVGVIVAVGLLGASS